MEESESPHTVRRNRQRIVVRTQAQEQKQRHKPNTQRKERRNILERQSLRPTTVMQMQIATERPIRAHRLRFPRDPRKVEEPRKVVEDGEDA